MSGPKKNAIVVANRFIAEAIEGCDVLAGFYIITPGMALAGRRFDNIVMAWAPEAVIHKVWVREELVLKLRDGAKLTWIV